MGQVRLSACIQGVAIAKASTERPLTANPSIEGTSNIRLRLLLAAPHVKR